MLIDAARELGDSVGEAISAHAADVDNVPMDDLLQKIQDNVNANWK